MCVDLVSTSSTILKKKKKKTSFYQNGLKYERQALIWVPSSPYILILEIE